METIDSKIASLQEVVDLSKEAWEAEREVFEKEAGRCANIKALGQPIKKR